MPYNFKCGLCKETKEIQMRSKIILWTLSDLHSDSWCSNCINKVINICKSPRLDKTKRQAVMDQFGVDIR